MISYLLVGLGGFLGANARLLIARLVERSVDSRFPLATFVINVGGSFLLGILGAAIAQRLPQQSDAIRLALGVGFLGAFTTFSTFEMETHALLEDGSWLIAAVYIAASVLVGLVALRGGIALAKVWLP